MSAGANDPYTAQDWRALALNAVLSAVLLGCALVYRESTRAAAVREASSGRVLTVRLDSVRADHE